MPRNQRQHCSYGRSKVRLSNEKGEVRERLEKVCRSLERVLSRRVCWDPGKASGRNQHQARAPIVTRSIEQLAVPFHGRRLDHAFKVGEAPVATRRESTGNPLGRHGGGVSVF